MGIGLVVMAVGVASLIWGGFVTAVAAVFCYGTRIGLVIPAGNLMTAECNPEHCSSTLNLLNFSWSAGAVSCPFLLTLFEKTDRTQSFLNSIAGLLVATAGVLLVSSVDIPQLLPEQNSTGVARTPFELFRTPTAMMLATLFFVYVGTESGLGAWLASYARRATQLPLAGWMTVPSYFYGTLLLGRVLAPLTLEHISDTRQASLGALLAAASSAVLISSRSISAIAICALLAGLGLSTLYPITIALLSSTFGPNATKIGGVMFALSTLGGASIPWLVGFASTEFNGLRTGLIILPAGCVLMLAIFSSARWRQYAR